MGCSVKRDESGTLEIPIDGAGLIEVAFKLGACLLKAGNLPARKQSGD